MTSPRVMHYVREWLPLSQQFVHAQVSRSELDAVVVSANPVTNLDAFPIANVHSLSSPLASRRLGRISTLMAIRRRGRVKLLHVHFGYGLVDIAAFVRVSRIPLVVSLHGHDVTAWQAASSRKFRRMLSRAQAVIVPSRYLEAAAVDAGANASAIKRIPAGVDREVFRPSPTPSEPRVLFVGRLVEKKGIDVLMSSWPIVRSAIPNAELTVLGDGDAAGIVHGASVRHLKPDTAAPREQVARAMRDAALVVTPSRTSRDGDAESCLLVNLEAMASGRAVVSTQHGGIPEFVADGVTGILVPEGDANELASALIMLLADVGLRIRLGQRGPGVAARFDVADCARRVDSVYRSVLHAR